MCKKFFNKLLGGGSSAAAPQVLPAQSVSAQPVASGASVKTAVKGDDKDRSGEADLRSDVTANGGGKDDPTANIPTPGGVSLGAKKKRKKIVGLDL